MFSLTPNETVVPAVPVPAPAKISPVGFSSIEIFIVFVSSFLLSITSPFTSLKKLSDLMLLIDLVYKILLKGSPSSITT